MSENNSERKDVYIKIKKPLILNFNTKTSKIKITHYIVYKITNLLTGHFYIGAHKQKFVDPYEFDGYWSSSKRVLKSIEKYGEENFKRETIEVCKTWWDALDRETFWIEELKSNRNKYPNDLGMNLNSGGWNSKNKSKEYGFTGQNHSDETRKKMSESHKKGPKGKDHKNYGRQQSKKTKQKISESLKGEKNPMYGQHHTKETKEKIGKINKGNAYNKGRHPTKETKEKMSKSKLGKKMDENFKKLKSEQTIGENNPNSLYVYKLLNGEDFYKFFDTRERNIISTLFRYYKSDIIEYKGIKIKRILKRELVKKIQRNTQPETYSKYIYILSNGEDFWKFFNKKDRTNINNRLRRNEYTIYKGITITRVLKDKNKQENKTRTIICKYIFILSNNKDYWDFFNKKERDYIYQKFSKSKSDTIIYKGITITRVLKDKGENQNG